MVFTPGCSGSGTDEDCGGACGSGTVCDASTGQCVADEESANGQSGADACTTDGDCLDATLKCVDGACVSKCEGVVCDASVGEVVTRQPDVLAEVAVRRTGIAMKASSAKVVNAVVVVMPIARL